MSKKHILLNCLMGSFLTLGASACTTDDGGEGGAGGGGVDLCADVVCAALDECHEVGVCDPATGECTQPYAPSDTACDDSDACTYGDHCEDGACVGGNAVICRPQDQCHLAGVCDPATGCSNPVKSEGAACGDYDACTKNDRCESGVCVGDAVTCSAVDECHEVGECNPGTGECTTPRKTDGTSCSIGGSDLCTVGECVSGACDATAVVCEALDDCHLPGVCDPATGNCSNPDRDNGDPCEDGDLCTENDVCQAGVCATGSAVTCLPTDDCHDAGSCDPATGCTYPPKPDGEACDDGDLCTQTDTCEAGGCVGGDPIVCSPLDDCHVTGVCDSATGLCDDPPIEDGVACEDGDLCSAGDTCQAGLCAAGASVTCDQPTQCEGAGSCDPALGCVYAPLSGIPCDDDDLCTVTDSCDAGVCVGADPVICAALGGCYDVGVCDPMTGDCSNPMKLNDAPCDDDDPCTLADACFGGACLGGASVVCNDPCLESDQYCDTGSGTCAGTSKTDGTVCEDGDACTPSATCQAGRCIGAAPVTCTALDACHDIGYCDPASGMCTNPHLYAGTACSAGLCFSDETASAGITWTNPLTTATHVGGGAAFFDADGDGVLDIILAGEGGGIALYRNNGDGTFEERTAAAGLPTAVPMGIIMGVAIADYDNDDDDDIYVLSLADNRLYQNQGAGTFLDVTSDAGLDADLWSTAASFADFDLDGDLDLYVGNYAEVPCCATVTPLGNQLFENQGDGTFADVTADYGLAGLGATMAVHWSDYDADGYVDLLVCNAHGATLETNLLFHNDGASATGPSDWFSDVSAAMGIDTAMDCQGIAAGDYDNDLDLDFYFSNIGSNRLARQGAAIFGTAAAGAALDTDACTSEDTASWGAGFADLDGDGDLDLYVANGFHADPDAPASAADSPNAVLLSDGSAFTDISMSAGVGDPRRGRGVAFGDYDDDGDIDILQINVDGTPLLLRNDTVQSNGWLVVELTGAISNRDAVGAHVEVQAGADSYLREANAGGFLSASDPRLHFGIGSESEASQVEVRWPSGIAQQILHVPSASAAQLTEPEVTAETVTVTNATEPVAEGTTIDVDIDLDKHTAGPGSADYSIEVLVAGQPTLAGPGGTVIFTAAGTETESVSIAVPTGAAGGAIADIEVVVTVMVGAGLDQGMGTSQIEP